MKTKIFQILAIVSVMGLSLGLAGCGSESCADSAPGDCAGDKIMTTCCESEDASTCSYTYNDGESFTADEVMEALSYCSAE
jgi:hypothetical protein